MNYLVVKLRSDRDGEIRVDMSFEQDGRVAFSLGQGWINLPEAATLLLANTSESTMHVIVEAI